MNTLQLGLIQGSLCRFGANCNMSQNTILLCYFFLLKYPSVLYFTLFPSLRVGVLTVPLNIDTKYYREPSGEYWHPHKTQCTARPAHSKCIMRSGVCVFPIYLLATNIGRKIKSYSPNSAHTIRTNVRTQHDSYYNCVLFQDFNWLWMCKDLLKLKCFS